MHRDHAGRMDAGRQLRGRPEDLVGCDLEPALVERALEQQLRPGRQPLGKPALVEPGRGRRRPGSSATLASRMVRCRRRVGRSLAERTSTSIVASSPVFSLWIWTTSAGSR